MLVWSHWVIVAAHRFPLVLQWAGSALSLRCAGFSSQWLHLLRSMGSRACGLQQFQHMVLVALWHVGSSCTQDWTGLACIATWILNHWTTSMCACSVESDCDAMNWSSSGSSVHEISQARILEWVAISSSRGSSWPKDRTHDFCISCIGRQILYHFTSWEAPWTTRKALKQFLEGW